MEKIEEIQLEHGESDPENREYIINSNNINYKLLITLDYQSETYEFKICEINFIPKYNYIAKYNYKMLKIKFKLDDKNNQLDKLLNFFDDMHSNNKLKLINDYDSIKLIINTSSDTSEDNETLLKLEKKLLDVNDKFDFIINEINNIKKNNISLIEKRFDEIMKRLNDIENSINHKIKYSADSLNLLKNENEKPIKNEQDKIQELKTEPLKLINKLIINKDDIDLPREIKTAKGEIHFDDFEIIDKKNKKEEKKDKVDKNKIDENKEKNVININNKDNINEIKLNDENKNNNLKNDNKISPKKSLIVNKKPSFKNDLKIIKLFDPDDDKTQLFFFAILIGESNVGKTWIFNNFFTLPFAQSLSIGLESEEIFFKIEEETLISLNILVCPGKFTQLSLISSKDLIIFIYSIDNRNSFENLKAKIKEIKTKSKKEAHYILVGNKIDLETQRLVKKEEGEKLAKDENFDLFLEVSAKDGKNIDKIFFDACKILYKNRVINA